MVCDRDIAASARICAYCEKRPDGKNSSAGAEAFQKMTAMYAPVVLRFQDRGGRSPEGCQHDDCRKRYRRAVGLGYKGVHDRWLRDEAEDFHFRRNMIGEGWKEEDMEWIDEAANFSGNPPPRKGEGTGRNAEERRRY